MAIVIPSADEVVSKGEAIYNRDIKSLVEPARIGEFVAIDIVSGEYEIGRDQYATTEALRSRQPNAIVCTLKIGYTATAVIGGRLRRNKDTAPT